MAKSLRPEIRYPSGVIDQKLPSTGAELPPDTALQDPDDYLEVLYRGIPKALAAGKVAAEEVIGIGIDFTCCTVLPVTEDGVPLCELDHGETTLTPGSSSGSTTPPSRSPTG